MGAVAFNTYELIKNLEKAGMSEEQAEVISTSILRAHEVAGLATKADLRESQAQTKADLRESQAQTKADLQEVKADLKATETALRAELRESQAQTKAEIDKLEAKFDGEIKLLKWMLGVTLAGVGSLVVMAISLVIKTFFGT